MPVPTMTATEDLFALDLRPWVDRPGPIVTAWLPAPSAIEAAPSHLRQHAKSVTDALGDEAPRAALDAILRTVEDDERAHVQGESLLVLADASGQVDVVGLPDEVPAARAWVGELPRSGPVLEARQHVVPHVVVVADRIGADMVAVSVEGHHRTHAADGSELHVHRGQPGGWSQRRFQQRAENRWESNAAAVADEVDALRDAVGARVVVATGDVRALQLLGEHAPPALVDVLVVHDGPGRSDEDPFGAIQPEVDRQVATVVANDTREILERFAAMRAKGVAVDGPEPVLEVLSEGRVDVLVVHDDQADERAASIDRETGQVATDPARLSDLGLSPRTARLVDAATWAAGRSGASVRLVPAHGPDTPAGHLGAILRG